jgi:cell division protein FtsQ
MLRPGPKSRRRAYKRRLGFAVFTGLFGVLAFSILTDGGRKTRTALPLLPHADQVLAWTGLRIEQVTLSGQRFASDIDVFEAIDLKTGRSLATFDSQAARQRIEKLPWIETASINRVYPGALEVHVVEREPAAVWSHEGRTHLIDATGRVLSTVRSGEHPELPQFTGAGAPEHAQTLLDLMARFPLIAERFERAERVGDRRWTLHLRERTTVHLGAGHEAVAFAKLSSPDALAALLSGRDLTIDLRTRGRVAVRRTPQRVSGQAAAALTKLAQE